MSVIRNRRASHSRIGQILLCLTLFALLFRGAFPTGYMPALAGQGNHTLTLTLCTAYAGADPAPTAIRVDMPRTSEPGSLVHSCPFCAVVSQALMPGAAPPALATAITHDITLTLSDRAAPLPALIPGPPLGSRAPPPHFT